MGNKHPNWHPRDYNTLKELHAELDRIEQSHNAGTLKTTGNWSAGQIFDHCSKPMQLAFDGFFDDESKPIRFPFLIRMMGTLILKPMLGRSHMKPGIKLPAEASSMMPQDDCTFEQGIGNLRDQLARIDNGETMTQTSPLLGKMRHDQWVKMHLDHCRMHFGFIQVND